MSTLLGDKYVGAVVKIIENGTPVNFIIVHKGRPSPSLYDSSCDGIWLLREQAHSQRSINSELTNSYEDSKINVWLNDEYYNSIDSRIREEIKQIKIPFKKGRGDLSTGVQSGENGLPCKVFLLSAYEVGFTQTDHSNIPIDGGRLSYFLNGLGLNSDANIRRIAKDPNDSPITWWLRSPYLSLMNRVWSITSVGGYDNYACNTGFWARPAFVLPSSLLVGNDDVVSTNIPPEITADKSGSLETLTDGFDITYSVNDTDGDPITVTESLDNVSGRSYEAVPGQSEKYSLRGNDWLKITNGTHTFTISASDGKDTSENTITFTRDQTSAFVCLRTPLEADDIIRFCSLRVDGVLPADTIMNCEVTNNALDDEPVWEDCTLKVRAGLSYSFKNQLAEKGFAFSFRVTVQRGSSEMGGFITKISGGFE